MSTATELVGRLISKNMHITTAESCTGGMISSMIVDVPDASKVLSLALVTYSDEIKTEYLKVSPDYIEKFGVVSEQVAALMALGAARAAKAETAIATTGYVGPTGGDAHASLGTVCFGYFINEKVFTETLHFDGDRNENRKKAAEHALSHMLSLLN